MTMVNRSKTDNHKTPDLSPNKGIKMKLKDTSLQFYYRLQPTLEMYYGTRYGNPLTFSLIVCIR